jgi:hypothetical protein
MHRGGVEIRPEPAARARLDRDYAVFLAIHRHRAEIDPLVGAPAAGSTAQG